MKAVPHNFFEVYTKLGLAFGAVGGLFNYLLQYQANTSYWPSLGKAALTAFICGIAGAIGGWLFKLAMKKIKSGK